jgi:hypothetical protein
MKGMKEQKMGAYRVQVAQDRDFIVSTSQGGGSEAKDNDSRTDDGGAFGHFASSCDQVVFEECLQSPHSPALALYPHCTWPPHLGVPPRDNGKPIVFTIIKHSPILGDDGESR